MGQGFGSCQALEFCERPFVFSLLFLLVHSAPVLLVSHSGTRWLGKLPAPEEKILGGLISRRMCGFDN